MAVTFKKIPQNSDEIKRFYSDGDFFSKEISWIEGDPLHEEKNRVILEIVEKIRPEKVIEIGCGEGKLIEMAAPLAKNMAVGMDISEKRLPRSTKNALYFAGDAEVMPIGDSSFDCIICSEVLEHLPDIEVTLTEIWRILAKDGHFIVTVPNTFSFDSFESKTHLVEKTLKLANRFGSAFSEKKIFPFGWNTHIHKKSVNEWKYCLNNAGYFVVDSCPIYTFPYIPYFLKPLKRLEKRLWRSPQIRQLLALGANSRFLSKSGQLHLFYCKKQ